MLHLHPDRSDQTLAEAFRVNPRLMLHRADQVVQGRDELWHTLRGLQDLLAVEKFTKVLYTTDWEAYGLMQLHDLAVPAVVVGSAYSVGMLMRNWALSGGFYEQTRIASLGLLYTFCLLLRRSRKKKSLTACGG